MPAKINEDFFALILSSLNQDTQWTNSPQIVAEINDGIWLRITKRLTPVIGIQGVRAIIQRALTITSRTYPSIAIIDYSQEIDQLLENFKKNLTLHDKKLAIEISAAVIAAFITILNNLIGEPLTCDLLESVWLPSTQIFTEESEL